MTNIQFIAKSVATTPINIEKTVQLLQEDCTIPFISRYRKDQTGNLDEVVIEQIAKLSKQYDEIVKPELCGQLVSTERARNQWSTVENLAKKNSLKQKKDDKTKKFVIKFIEEFVRVNGREPIDSEIVDNLKDQLDVSQLKQITEKIKTEKPKLTNKTALSIEVLESPV